MIKQEWRKQCKELYFPKAMPTMLTVPAMKFFTLQGKGNPNGDRFAEEVSTLFSLSYAIKMMPKQSEIDIPKDYFDFAVFPLEGTWDLTEEAKTTGAFDKDRLCYTIMIRQPDFVSDALAKQMLEQTKRKKGGALFDLVQFETIEEGDCLQMLHLGPYDTELESFAEMEAFCKQNNLKRTSLSHREIYLTDARKTAPDKQKTVLRIKIAALDEDAVDQYISSFPENVQEKLKVMRAVISAAAPTATEKISYQMPTFVLNGNLVHFAAFKNHIGFYPTPSAITEFAAQLTPYHCSKGAVQFPMDEPLPVELIEQMVRFRVSEALGKQKKK